MAKREHRKAADALGALLGEGASPAVSAAGRSLLLALVRLHELGALDFDTDAAAVHGRRPEGEPGTVDGCCSAQPSQTAPSYNMGQSICIDGESE